MMSATADLARVYSAKARAYAALWAPVLSAFAVPLLDALPLAAAGRILDLGAGTGHLLDPIRVRAPRGDVILADRAPGMLALVPAAARAPRVVVDAQELSFAAGVFDVAVLVFMLFHVPKPRAALNEVRRVLRPGGLIGVVTWSEDSALPGADIITEELDAVGAGPNPRDPSTMQGALMDSREKLSSLLVESGFGDVQVRTTRFEHPFTVPGLVELQTGVCAVGRRLEGVPGEQAARCRKRVAERMHQLGPEELIFRPEVVWGSGTAPD